MKVADGDRDAAGSAYAVSDYEVDARLGGDAALASLISTESSPSWPSSWPPPFSGFDCFAAGSAELCGA